MNTRRSSLGTTPHHRPHFNALSCRLGITTSQVAALSARGFLDTQDQITRAAGVVEDLKRAGLYEKQSVVTLIAAVTLANQEVSE